MVSKDDKQISQCFLCGKISNRIVQRELSYEGRRCSCGMVYTSPTPLAGVIDWTSDHHPEEFYSYPAEFKARWVASHCPRGRLLEIGCGNGAFLIAARAHGYEVSGIEPDVRRARHVTERLGISVEQSLLENSTLPRHSFDVVYHCDLLAHFPNPIENLRAMSAFLRPGGVLCFEVGILGGISPLWYKLVGNIGLGYHLWLYSEQALTLLFAQAGLRVAHIQRFGLAPLVIFGRAARLVRRLARSIVSALQRFPVCPSLEAIDRHYHKFIYFLRYRVGKVAPQIGPQTLLVVVWPTSR